MHWATSHYSNIYVICTPSCDFIVHPNVKTNIQKKLKDIKDTVWNINRQWRVTYMKYLCSWVSLVTGKYILPHYNYSYTSLRDTWTMRRHLGAAEETGTTLSLLSLCDSFAMSQITAHFIHVLLWQLQLQSKGHKSTDDFQLKMR